MAICSAHNLVVASGLLFAAAALAQAQDDPHPRATATAVAPPSEPLATLPATGGTERAVAFVTQLDASTDEKTATAVIGWKNGMSNYALTFKGPLNSRTKEAVPISLEGLNNGASVQFALSHLFWRGSDADEIAEMIEICKPVEAKGESCDFHKLPPGALRRRLGELLHIDDIPWFVGLSGGASVATYNFLSGAELTKDSQTKTDVALTGRVGIFTPQFGFLILSAGFQRASSPGADPIEVCRPLDGSPGVTTCANAVLKPPTASTGTIVTFQMRRGLTGGVAIAPTIQRDLEKRVTSVQIPVYFLRDAKGTPIGGIRGTWRSDTKTATMSLFIGAAFQLSAAAQ